MCFYGRPLKTHFGKYKENLYKIIYWAQLQKPKKHVFFINICIPHFTIKVKYTTQNQNKK